MTLFVEGFSTYCSSKIVIVVEWQVSLKESCYL